MTDDELQAILDNAPVRFGLVAQGHIPKIEQMLVQGESWASIGRAIGWCPKTAKEHYDRYLERKM